MLIQKRDRMKIGDVRDNRRSGPEALHLDNKILGRLGLNQEGANWAGIRRSRNLAAILFRHMVCPGSIMKVTAMVAAEIEIASNLGSLLTVFTTPQGVETITQHTSRAVHGQKQCRSQS